MTEHFAPTADVDRLGGERPDPVDRHPSADGRGETQAASVRRLARMVGLDALPSDPFALRRRAGVLVEAQMRTLSDGREPLVSRGELAAEGRWWGLGSGALS